MGYFFVALIFAFEFLVLLSFFLMALFGFLPMFAFFLFAFLRFLALPGGFFPLLLLGFLLVFLGFARFPVFAFRLLLGFSSPLFPFGEFPRTFGFGPAVRQ